MTGVLVWCLAASLAAGALLVASPLLRPGSRSGAPRGSGRVGRGVADRLASAGLPEVSTAAFVAVSALIGVVAGAVVLAVTGLPALGLLALAGGALGPWTIAGARSRSRSRANRALWPEVVDHLVSSVRAGQPLPDALAGLAVTGPVALRSGFALFERRWRETGTVGAGLDAVKARFADPTADRLIEILRMARQVGGTELPGVLRDLALHLRQDLALRAEAEARQSWVTNSAKLGVVAPWIVLVMLALEPRAAAAFATPQGTVLILVALGVCVAAYRMMIAIGRLPEDRRWFR
ncbi:type II secretion system F family protein [uncultured Amnibacterium sp.]|uniref:type II secretion system F family protein n=1 Tax=uncultured Amnibacterium sp. TaxID=1631851 RepID=UPI0035CC54EA